MICKVGKTEKRKLCHNSIIQLLLVFLRRFKNILDVLHKVVILVTMEAKMRRIAVQNQSWANSS
jgi:hypothetical protein